MKFAGIFESLTLDTAEQRIASRKAVALASVRIKERFGKFFANAPNPQELDSRFALVQDDFTATVRMACEEVGHSDHTGIAESIRSSYRLPEPEPKIASTKEARRPRLCPYHQEVIDISLAQGEPRAGYDAMAQHAWGNNHCQGGDYQGRNCNFKRDMVTQGYWDQKTQEADVRRQQRELERQQQPSPEDAWHEPQDLTDTIAEPQEGIDQELSEAPSAVGGGMESAPAPLEPALSNWRIAEYTGDHFLDSGSDRESNFEKEAPGNKHLPYATDKRNRQYEHIKDSYEDEGTSTDDAKELAARTVNKQRAEKGETKKSDYPGEEEYFYENGPGGGFHGEQEVPPGHPDQLDYQGFDPEGGQACPHNPHWRHCELCNPQGPQGPTPQDHYDPLIPPTDEMRPFSSTSDKEDSNDDPTCECGHPKSAHNDQGCDMCLEETGDEGGNEAHGFKQASRTGEALRTEDVTKGGEGPSPKIDKGNSGNNLGWTLKAIDSEEDGSPNPTVDQDIMDSPDYKTEDFLDQTEAVAEHEQSLAEDTGPKPIKDNNAWGDNGTDPVTSSFISHSEVLEAIEEYKNA